MCSISFTSINYQLRKPVVLHWEMQCVRLNFRSLFKRITETPQSRLVSQLNHRTQLFEKRKILLEVNNAVERDMNADSDIVVLQNRISWEKFDNVCQTQGLDSTNQQNKDENTTPSRKHKHGCESNYKRTPSRAENSHCMCMPTYAKSPMSTKEMVTWGELKPYMTS